MLNGLSFGGLAKARYALLRTCLLALVLLVVEEFLEGEFKCPQGSRALTIIYSLAFFLVPSWILLMLALMLQPGTLRGLWAHGRCGLVLPGVWLPPLLWVLVLLVDGQYFYCLVTGLYKWGPPGRLYYYHITQLFGLCISALLVLGFFIWAKCGTKPWAKCEKLRADALGRQHLGQLQEEAERQIWEKAEEEMKRAVKELLTTHLAGVEAKTFLDRDTLEVVSSLTQEAKNLLEETLYPVPTPAPMAEGPMHPVPTSAPMVGGAMYPVPTPAPMTGDTLHLVQTTAPLQTPDPKVGDQQLLLQDPDTTGIR